MGRKVPTQPILLNSTNRGIIITWPGSIMVTTMATNQKLRPLNRTRARPKATRAEESTIPAEESRATNREFLKKVPKVYSPNPFQPTM